MTKFKSLRKLLVVPLALITVFTLGIPAAPASTANGAPTVPETTSVTIHKVVGTGGFTLQNHDGSLLTPAEIAALGTGAVENNTDVEFTVWSAPAGAVVGTYADMTDTQVTTALGDPAAVVAAGVAHDFGTGTYYVRETTHPATLETQIGVPFIMELPVLNVAGDAYLTTLHLYPKNVIENDMPTAIDKDVVTKGQDDAGFDVGKTFTYLIYPDVPEAIEDYAKYIVADDLDSQLDYMDNVVVTYNDVALIAGTDYSVVADPSGTAGGKFTLTFLAPGLEKLAAAATTGLVIKFDARINNTAAMGTEILNDATLTYNNGYMTTDGILSVALVDQPEVHTGGRHFVKIDNVTQAYLAGLASAQFYVKNAAGKYMVQDAMTGAVTWQTGNTGATKVDVDDATGAFLVKGLAYGDTGLAFTYYLEEATTPDGYVKMADVSFTIDANSYKTDQPANTIKVTNVKRPLIPQTGGIGTIIFLAAGIAVMGGAAVAMKRKRAQTKK